MSFHGALADEAQRIILFVNRMQRPAITEVEPSRIDSFETIDDGVCLCSASRDKHAGFVAVFEDVAEKYRSEYTFGLVADEDVPNPSVTCRRHKDSKQKAYGHDPPGVEAFVIEALRPTISDLTLHNHQRLLEVSGPFSPDYPEIHSTRDKRVMLTWALFTPLEASVAYDIHLW